MRLLVPLLQAMSLPGRLAAHIVLICVVAVGVAVASLVASTPVSAAECPTSIEEAVVVSEVGGTVEYSPSELDRPFPDISEGIAPGSRARDELVLKSIAEVPVDSTLILKEGDADVAASDHDLLVQIQWAGETVLEGSYSDIIGRTVDLGTMTPGSAETLTVDVDLPEVEGEDNDRQSQSWPLNFNLGVGTGSDCQANSGAEANDEATGEEGSGGAGGSDPDSTSAGASSSTTSSTSADAAGNTIAGFGLARNGFGDSSFLILGGTIVLIGAITVLATRRSRR